MAIQQNVVRQLQPVVCLSRGIIIKGVVPGAIQVVPIMITNHAQPSQLIASVAHVAPPVVSPTVVVEQAVTVQPAPKSSHSNMNRAFAFTECPESTGPQLIV